MTDRDSLRAEVKRRMLAGIESPMNGLEQWWLRRAVAVVVEMTERERRKPSQLVALSMQEIAALQKRAEAAETRLAAIIGAHNGKMESCAARIQGAEKERDDMKAAWYAVSKEAKELEEARDLNARYCDDAKKALAEHHKSFLYAGERQCPVCAPAEGGTER